MNAPILDLSFAEAPAAGAPAAQSASWWSALAESLARSDHPRAMAHCAEMRQTVRRGGRLSPDMQGMMAHCDQMDRSMRSSQPR